jgi:hypothetical protein
MTNTYLSKIKPDLELLLCNDAKCKCVDHIHAIDDMYNQNLNCLLDSSQILLGDKKVNFKKQVPGWNEWVKEHHAQAREAFLMWRAGGSPRAGVLFDAMKRTQAFFKLALRQCRKDKER